MSKADDNNNDMQLGGSGEMMSSKKECTSCEQNNVNNIIDGINAVAILDDTSICAACGKEGNSDDMNTCNKCKEVKYCNAACKKKHRKKHKKACEKRVAELHDEKLFKEVERKECPICLIPLPLDVSESTVNSCCGKHFCAGCEYAMKMSEGKDLCAFCRSPPASSEEETIKRLNKLMDKGNAEGCFLLASCYAQGSNGMPRDYRKTNELLFKAGELGCAEAYCKLGSSYFCGIGLEIDTEKARHYYELAAMGGDVEARYNLGRMEGRAGNIDRASKHFTIATRAGHVQALDMIKRGFKNGIVTKEEYANTLRAHHESQKEMKSDERDKAGALIRVPGLIP